MTNQANILDPNLQYSFENFLMNSTNISPSEASAQMNEIQNNAMNIINSQDPEIQRRLDLIEEIDPDELNEELQYLVKELSTNQYTPEEQMEISNSLFNIFGFNIELDANNQVQINLVEPTIDELEEYDDEDSYEDDFEDFEDFDDELDDDLDDIYDDFESFDTPSYNAYSASNTSDNNAQNNQNRNNNSTYKFEDDFDFDY